MLCVSSKVGWKSGGDIEFSLKCCADRLDVPKYLRHYSTSGRTKGKAGEWCLIFFSVHLTRGQRISIYILNFWVMEGGWVTFSIVREGGCWVDDMEAMIYFHSLNHSRQDTTRSDTLPPKINESSWQLFSPLPPLPFCLEPLNQIRNGRKADKIIRNEIEDKELSERPYTAGREKWWRVGNLPSGRSLTFSLINIILNFPDWKEEKNMGI